MPTHHLPEAELELPHGWQDQTVTSYVLPRPDGEAGGAATLVVTRDYQSVRDLAPGEDFLERYADAQLVEAARRLPGFAVVGRAPGAVGGRRAMVVESAWTLPDQGARGRVRQRQAFVRLGDRVVVVTLTAREEDFAQHAALWGGVLAGVRWRPGAGLPPLVVRPPTRFPAGPPGDGGRGPAA